MRASVWRVGGRRMGGNGERKEGAIRSWWWFSLVVGWVTAGVYGEVFRAEGGCLGLSILNL